MAISSPTNALLDRGGYDALFPRRRRATLPGMDDGEYGPSLADQLMANYQPADLAPAFNQAEPLPWPRLTPPAPEHAPPTALTPEEEHSLLQRLGQTGASALQWTAESLDKPAAAVRGVLSGLSGGQWGGGLLNLIPLSDTLGITNPEERVQPEDITGWKPDETDSMATKVGKFAGNLGFGIATDPSFWLPGGIMGALSRGGKMAEATGVLSKAANYGRLAKDIGKSAEEIGKTGEVGRRVFMQSHTLGDLLAHAEKVGGAAGREAAEAKLATYSAKSLGDPNAWQKMLDQPLGGLVGLGPGRLPGLGDVTFGESGVAGTSGLARSIAGVEDTIGEGIKSLPGVRHATSLLSAAAQGFTNRATQKLGPGYEEAKELGATAARKMGQDFTDALDAANETSRAAGLPELSRKNFLGLAGANPDQLGEAVARVVEEHGWTPEQAQGLWRMAEEARGNEGVKDVLAAAGVRPKELDSFHEAYLSRRAVPGGFPNEGGMPPVASVRGLKPTDRAAIQRNLALDMPGGQARAEEFFQDPLLNKIHAGTELSPDEAETLQRAVGQLKASDARRMMKTVERGPKATDQEFGELARVLHPDIPDVFVDQKGWKKLRDFVAKQAPDELGALGEGADDEIASLWEAVRGGDQDALVDLAAQANVKLKPRFPVLGKIFRSATPEARAAGLFGGEQPGAVIERMAQQLNARQAKANYIGDLLALPDSLSEAGTVAQSGPRGGVNVFRPTTTQRPVVLKDLFRNLRMKLGDTETGGAIKSLADRLGIVPPTPEALEEIVPGARVALKSADETAAKSVGRVLDVGEDGAKVRFHDRKSGVQSTVTLPMEGLAVLPDGHPAAKAYQSAIKKLALNEVDPTLATQILHWADRGRAMESANPLLNLYDKATGMWKAFMTAHPAFTTRNLFSMGAQSASKDMLGGRATDTALRMLSGGTPAADYLLKHPYTALMAAEKNIPLAEVTPELAEKWLWNLTDRHGAVGDFGAQGMATGLGNANEPFNLGKTLGKFIGQGEDVTLNPLAAKYGGPLGPGEKALGPIAGMNDLNRLAENQTRLAAWLKLGEQGYDPAVAKKLANDAHFRYGREAFTPFENSVLKRAFPFYSFTRQASADTVRTLAGEPGGKLAQLIRAQSAMAPADDEIVPEHLRQGMTVRIPEGTPLIGPEPGGDPRYLTGMGFVHEQEPFGYMGAGLGGAALEVLSRANPLVKAPIEYAFGRSSFQRGPGGARSLEDQDPVMGRILSNVADTITGQRSREPVRLPLLAEQIAANSPASRGLTTLRTLTDPRKSWAASLSNTLSGVKFTDVPEAAREKIERAAIDTLRRGMGGKAYEGVYIPREQRAAMTPDQRGQADELQKYQTLLSRRAQARRVAAAPLY